MNLMGMYGLIQRVNLRALHDRIRRHPVAFAILVSTLSVTAFGIGQGVYWAAAQADPQIIERGVSYFHLGVDIDGHTFQQWKALGFRGTWVPAKVDLVRSGQTLWLQRDLEFTNKTLATVTRVLVCDGGFQFTWDPVPPPTRTEARTVKQFQVTIPQKAEGRCVYRVAAIFYKNPSQPEVRVAFQPVAITVVP